MRILYIILATQLFTIFSCTYSQGLEITLTEVAKDLTGPVAMDSPKDGSNRLFVCEQTGKVKIIQPGSNAHIVFLDISSKLDKIGKGYTEKGLLGIAFHPQYKSNGRFFVYYSAPPSGEQNDHTDVVEEYKVTGNASRADASSGKIILKVSHPESNHNGGQLAFGPDGYLYIGLGDGGGGGDKHGMIGNAQDLNALLGKILRVDVDSKSPYGIPKDNPFINTKNAKPEIYAYGLRNPWRFSFDRKTGQLFCADVGQNKYEEINMIDKGKNYGWRLKEASHCYNPETNCNKPGLIDPIAEYGRDLGISVTGGYVYHGNNNQKLSGRYVFADWKGDMYYLEKANDAWQMKALSIAGKKSNNLGMNINSFGEDEKGNVYILAQKFTGTFTANGIIYLIDKGK